MAEVGQRREALRERLVETAEHIVATRGLAAMRARDLAEGAGCAVGAIYTAFDHLDALVIAVNTRTLALFERSLAAATSRREASGADAATRATTMLVRLAHAYLAFARTHPHRWRALFEHRLAGEASPPDWYLAEQEHLFRAVEEPLGLLCPALDAAALHLRARTVFSAVHGVVSLGLDEKLLRLPPAALKAEVEAVVRAMTAGLAAGLKAGPS